jgi:transcriptional regulator with XRE-family HTH domain
MKLKTARQIARLTQSQLAEQAGVDPALISRLEADTRRTKRPSYVAIVRISRVLNLAPDELFPVPPYRPRRRRPARPARVAEGTEP